MDGLVYINWGRVIVDCPYGCRNAYKVRPGQKKVVCNASDGCHEAFSLVFPSELGELVAELEKRPEPSTRNWFPTGHFLAERRNAPTNQSVSDLRQEFEFYRKQTRAVPERPEVPKDERGKGGSRGVDDPRNR